MARVKRGFLTYDTQRGKLSVSWRETLSLVADEILLRQLIGVKDKVEGKLLDVGCGAKPYSLLFSPLVTEYIGIDLPSTVHGVSHIDAYGDASALPFRSGSFDTVLCTEVLEHVSEPQQVVNELWRVLKVDGYLLLTAPQNYWVHEAPNDFYRFTRYGLTHIVKSSGFEVCSVTPMGGVFSVYVDTVSKLGILLLNDLNRLLRKLPRCSRLNLIDWPFTRIFIALPQWVYLASYFGVSSLAKRYGRLAWARRLMDRSSERFTLGNMVVAIKRSSTTMGLGDGPRTP